MTGIRTGVIGENLSPPAPSSPPPPWNKCYLEVVQYPIKNLK